jgi:hypothetical protein
MIKRRFELERIAPTMRHTPLLRLAVPALFLGCASQSAPPPAPAQTQAQTAASTSAKDELVGPPTVAWADMTKEQKGKFMKKVVMPKMQPLFAAFDPDDFKEIKCSTCHGKDPKAAGFKMPTADLPELPATHEGFVELAQKKPKVMGFMRDQVLPTMADLLGQKRFDPAKPQEGGFGCMKCHTMKTGS